MTKFFLTAALILFSFKHLGATEIATLVKVTGSFAIVDKGSRQGMKTGEQFTVQRQLDRAAFQIAKVRVIRVTKNRCAIEVVAVEDGQKLQKGDRLVRSGDAPQVAETSLPTDSTEPRSEPIPASPNQVQHSFEAEKENPEPVVRQKVRRQSKGIHILKQPWITVNVGGSMPNGTLSQAHSSGFRFGVSYMLPVERNLNVGVEINQAFLGRSRPGGSNLVGSSNLSSASVLEAMLVLERYLGSYLYLQTGGGIFRPKFRTRSADQIEATFSASKFGVFGGAGIFIPTSLYSGVTLTGRIHNYFDHTNKQYFGLTGGFRFHIR